LERACHRGRTASGTSAAAVAVTGKGAPGGGAIRHRFYLGVDHVAV
jgi:hypothetical protein